MELAAFPSFGLLAFALRLLFHSLCLLFVCWLARLALFALLALLSFLAFACLACCGFALLAFALLVSFAPFALLAFALLASFAPFALLAFALRLLLLLCLAF